MITEEEDHFSEGRNVLDMDALAAAVNLSLEMMKQEEQNPVLQLEAARSGITPEDIREQIDRVATQLLYIRLILVEEAAVRNSRVAAENLPAEQPHLPGMSDEELAKQVELSDDEVAKAKVDFEREIAKLNAQVKYEMGNDPEGDK